MNVWESLHQQRRVQCGEMYTGGTIFKSSLKLINQKLRMKHICNIVRQL